MPDDGIAARSGLTQFQGGCDAAPGHGYARQIEMLGRTALKSDDFVA